MRSQGAEFGKNGVRYRTWTDRRDVAALIVDATGKILRTVPLQAQGDGYFEGHDSLGQPGDLYRYRLNGEQDWPDPASRFQPLGVHGPSRVVDPQDFSWSDQRWSPPAFRDLVIYELHVGTFTSAGTFRGAIERLDHLVALGVTALELMPLGDFPGARNWGYDGVMLYAPARAYGEPNDLRALVDAAHARGLAVILDVVYNHFGPDGNYLGCYHSNYFDRSHTTPWGDAFNFSCAPVRDFFLENAPSWMREFHIDGFRLDATHTIRDESERHILAEIAARVHELGGFVIAEDERNDPNLLRAKSADGLGFDGCWADDFHHVVRVLLGGARESYFANFEGTPRELADTIAHGWHFRGQARPTDGEPRGGETGDLALEQFIYCISNHDQVGNHAFGQRLGQLVSPAQYRAASALLCLVPETPLLFMGQEWSAATPFLFFTDHNAELGKKITEGRRREFRHFAAFSDPSARAKIPDPQKDATFLDSKLRWPELENEEHAAVLGLYRACLKLRREMRAGDAARAEVRELADGVIALSGGQNFVTLVDLVGGHAPPQLPNEWLNFSPIFFSNDERFGGSNAAPFHEPTVLVLKRATNPSPRADRPA